VGRGEVWLSVSRRKTLAIITLETRIKAPPEVCFDLSRDLDLHVRTMQHTGEQAIAGRTTGLIELDEEVTWQARHFGVVHHHTSRITRYDRPEHFRDSMTRGRFARFEHDHLFEPDGAGTIMRDIIDFQSPLGVLGSIVDAVVLRRYLMGLIQQRNRVIQCEAERHAMAEARQQAGRRG
jgi:ligand-binding SRPBCC domain-containing protein